MDVLEDDESCEESGLSEELKHVLELMPGMSNRFV